MNITMYIQICSFIYFVLLFIVFTLKKKVNNIETKFYKIFLIINLFGLIIDIILAILSGYMNLNSFIYKKIARLYLIYFISWITLLCIYIYIVSKKITTIYESEKSKILNKPFKIFLYTYLLNIIVVLITPNYFKQDKFGTHSYGFASTYTYLISSIYIFLCIYFMIKSKNKNRKFIPVITYIILLIIAMFIQIINPSIILTPTVMTLTIFVMYFTIENPDVKMNMELAKNRNIIQNTMEEKNNFLFIVSTTLKTTINNLNELSLNAIKKDNKGLLKDNLLEINNEINYLSFTINNILNVSTMDINEIKVIDSKYNLKKLIEKIKLVNKSKINDKLNFRIEMSSLPDYFYGDKTLLFLVINSLLNNAFKYTEKGFIELRINSIVKYDMCRLIITIEDSGCGISISKINELLTDKNITKNELDRLNTNDLSINLIKKIIKKMGGYFIIKSKIDVGTEVKFVLDQKIINDNNNTIINNNKVLVATSNINLFNKINKYLENNYLVEKSLYGQDVIDKIRNKQEYKYILIDDNIDKRALGVLKVIKEINNKLKVIVILDNDTSIIKNQFIKDGFNDYILKSNIEGDLKRIINV